MVVGADGCPSGWFAVWIDESGQPCGRVFATAAELFAGPWKVVAIDIPIGLRAAGDELIRKERGADLAARGFLQGDRKSSVFAAPVREALVAIDRLTASEITCGLSGRGVSAQGFGIYAKIREVDEALQADRALRERVYEVHPEVSFAEMNGGQTVAGRKKDQAGRDMRTALVADQLGIKDAAAFLRGPYRRSQVADDDILDACAALWTARRIAAGRAVPRPNPPETDSTGLTMAIWA